MPRLALGPALLALLLLAGGWHGVDRLSPDARSRCLAGGGTVSRVGMAQAEACVRRFADRGNACRNDRDCEGQCRFVDDTRGPPPEHSVSEPAWMHPANVPPIGSAVVGHCQWSSDPFGCRSLVVNGRLREMSCTD